MARVHAAGRDSLARCVRLTESPNDAAASAATSALHTGVNAARDGLAGRTLLAFDAQLASFGVDATGVLERYDDVETLRATHAYLRERCDDDAVLAVRALERAGPVQRVRRRFAPLDTAALLRQLAALDRREFDRFLAWDRVVPASLATEVSVLLGEAVPHVLAFAAALIEERPSRADVLAPTISTYRFNRYVPLFETSRAPDNDPPASMPARVGALWLRILLACWLPYDSAVPSGYWDYELRLERYDIVCAVLETGTFQDVHDHAGHSTVEALAHARAHASVLVSAARTGNVAAVRAQLAAPHVTWRTLTSALLDSPPDAHELHALLIGAGARARLAANMRASPGMRSRASLQRALEDGADVHLFDDAMLRAALNIEEDAAREAYMRPLLAAGADPVFLGFDEETALEVDTEVLARAPLAALRGPYIA